jgi:hypothetical protein
LKKLCFLKKNGEVPHVLFSSNKVSQKIKKQIFHFLQPLKKMKKKNNKNFREILFIEAKSLAEKCSGTNIKSCP